MANTNEFTLVAPEDYKEKLGHAVVVGTTLVHNTPVAVIATAGEAIDGIIIDITAGGAGAPIAVAKVGDIAFVKLGTGGATVGDELEVATGGVLVEKSTGVAVAKALATGVAGERIPAIIK